MKVLHVISHFDLGGAERIAATIAKSRSKEVKHIMVEVVRTNSAYRQQFISECQSAGIQLLFSHVSNNKLAILLFPWWFLWCMIKVRPDVIHSHTEVPDLSIYHWYHLFGWLFPKVTYIRTIHNTVLWTNWKRIGSHVENFFKKRKANIAISESVQQSYLQHYHVYPPIIANGVEQVDQRSFSGIETDKINILFAGRFEEQKGVDILVDVIKQLCDDDHFLFHIVGSGSLQPLVDEVKQLPSVRLYDSINQLSSYLASFDYLFMPSRFEGLGILSIEASLAGTPTISSGCAGLCETLPDDWELCPVSNDAASYVTLFCTLNSHDRTRLAEKAYNFVVNRYSAAKMQQSYESVYLNKRIPAEKPIILFILHLPPPLHGASQVGQYIRDSKLINETFDCHYLNLTVARSLDDIGKGGVRKYIDVIRKLLEIRQTVKHLRPDLVYLTPNTAGAPFYKDWLTVRLLKHLHCPIVMHLHNKGVSTRQDKWLDNALYKRYFRQNKVILLSEALYADVQKYVQPEQVLICPNGIFVSTDDAQLSNQINRPPRILMLSNLLKAKGIIELLDVCQLLKQKGLRFSCTYVGGETADYSRQNFTAEIEKRGLSDYVTYVGPKYDAEKTAEFNDSDIFVLPSYTEAFPLVTLEAMSYGLPIVTTAVGGLVDQVDEGVNGFLIKTSDELADRLELLINDPDLRIRMGQAGRQKFLQNYTLTHFENRMVEILNQSLHS